MKYRIEGLLIRQFPNQLKEMVESAADFFSRNASLFTVLGVFGAISVYFSQLAVGSRWQRLGIVASLTIFLLVAFAIWKNIPPETSDQNPFDYVVNQPLGFTIFYVAFLAVVVSIVGVVLSFSNTLFFLILFLLIVVGIRIALWWVDFYSPFEESEFDPIEDEEAGLRLAYLFRNGIQVFLISGGILVVRWIQGAIPLEELLRFQITDLWMAILIGMCSGVAAGGAVSILIGIFGLFARVMIPRLRRGIEDLDEDEAEVFTAIMRSLLGRPEEEEGENR